MADSDVHGYLSSLLVSDRQSLVFLYQTVVGQREASLDEMVGELSRDVASAGRDVPPGLRHWLENPSSLAARQLARVIRLAGFYRDASSGVSLRSILGQPGFASVHPAAVRALAQTLGVRAAGELGEMLWATPVQQWHVRETSILRELGVLGWTSSIADLTRALGVPYDNPMHAAAEALAQFDPDDVLPPLLRITDEEDYAAALASKVPSTSRGEPPWTRPMAGAAEALGLLGDQRAVVSLRRLAADPVSSIACSAAVALARLGDDGADLRLVALSAAGDGHEGAEERARACGGLGLLAEGGHALGTEAHGALLTRLQDTQPEVRSAAVHALGAAGGGGADLVGVALEKETSPLVRIDMLRALGQLADATSVPQLLGILRSGVSASVKAEVLQAMGHFSDPALARYITPFLGHQKSEVSEAADQALRRLLQRPFSWPSAEPADAGLTVEVHTLEGARTLLLPPPVARERGFLDWMFGASTAEVARPGPVGSLNLDGEGVKLTMSEALVGCIEWGRSFSVQITREPIDTEGQGDIGVHFTIRQRRPSSAAEFETVAVSFWCSPSEALASLPVKSERLPCMNPHQAGAFLSALRFYSEVHGERLPLA
jgi:HEAT repeat protein